MTQFAFPNNQNAPPQFSEREEISSIPQAIRFKLWQPEVGSGFWKARVRACGLRVPMPKTTVNEDNLPETPENEVRFSGEVARMQRVPIAHPIDHASYDDLGTGILSPYSAHPFAARFRT
jgi:hypothetical protein